jgi:hypothetical protein
MGMSTNGILAYGYVIGDGAPPVTGLGEDEDWRPADFTADPDSEEYYDFDFQDWAVRKLMAAAGHPLGEDDYVDPEDTKKHWGVWFEAEGWGENPHYMLVAFEETAYDHPGDLDLTALEARRVEEKWDDKLDAVLKILGIEGLTYPQDAYKDVKREQSARWMLTSYYG